MDLLDRLLGHDAWTTRQLLEIARTLDDEQLDRRFDIGRGTLRATFEHIIRNMEVWTDLMADRPPRATGADSIQALIERLDTAAADLAAFARSIADRDAWDERWTDRTESPPGVRSFGGTIAHVITHSMHHRAQVLHMLRNLGVGELPEGDALTWESRMHPNAAAP